jgi:hypothetical protein
MKKSVLYFMFTVRIQLIHITFEKMMQDKYFALPGQYSEVVKSTPANPVPHDHLFLR